MFKKLLSLTIAILVGIVLNAQEFKIAVSAGLPVSVSNEYAASLDVSYLLNITNKFDVGLTTGFSYWFKKSAFDSNGINFLKTEEISILPIAITNRFHVSKKLALASDIGYAIPFSSSSLYKSGFYFAPRIQYNISGSTDIVLGYRVANLDLNSTTIIPISADMLTLGIEFKL